MPTVSEVIAQQRTQLGAALAAGVDQLSLDQEISFTRYVKLVLPLDGFVFWVKADLVNEGALPNAVLANTAAANQGPVVETAAPILTLKGSLHYATETRQDETETYSVNRVVFTSESPIDDLNQIDPRTLYIATFDGVRFAFSSRGSYYAQSQLYHYVGAAVYADMETQLVDALDYFNGRQVVSNSLPIWLSLNGYAPPYPDGFGNPRTWLYPSYLVPHNLSPPWISVHVRPDDTRGLSAAPRLGPTLSHTQLCADTVDITTYGLRNDEVMDFVDLINQFSLDTDLIGIMNVPVPRDEKRTQPELNTIAQKKRVTFEVSYYQNRARNVARQLIETALVDFRLAS